MNEDNTVTILDLLNLSLGTPEIGAVNFNLLHRFLLELVKHFSIARKQIDITGDISIQSALEEMRMVCGAKSQTHFLAYSSLGEHAGGKQDHWESTSVSGVRGKGSTDELAQGKGQDAFNTTHDSDESRDESGKRPGAGLKDQTKEALQTKRSKREIDHGDGEVQHVHGDGSGGGDVAATGEESKQRSMDDRAHFKSGSPLSQTMHSPQSAFSHLTGRSSFVTKESKRTSPASSKTDVRKRSLIEMVPGLYQLERKISILEAKFESLSAGPTNLELVQQARDLQNRDSSSTAAGDMWQAMNLVRRIEVTEGAIDGITAMLDDINEQLKKMKDNSPDTKLQELSKKLKNVSDSSLGKSEGLQAKLAEIEGRLKNIVNKSDLKPFITVKKMNEMMEFKLQNYRQVSPTAPKSPKTTISSKLAQTDTVETSSQPAQTSPTMSGQPAETASNENANDEYAQRNSATPSSEQALPGTTATTPLSERVEGEQADFDGTAFSDVDSIDAASLRAEQGKRSERRGSLTTEAFEELYRTMHDWSGFREEAAQKINDLEEVLSSKGDKSTLFSLEQELKNLAEIQSTLKNSQEQVKYELNKLAEIKNRPVFESIASQHDLNQLEDSLDGQLETLSKSLQEMKQNFFQLYEMKETVGGLKESEDHIKSDMESIRREIMKITKQLDEEQDVRKAFASSLGRKHSFAAGNGEDLHEIRSSILEIKNELDKHDAAMSQIMEDMNKKQLHLEALYGHLGQLENVKADKQQIDCEIQIKADRKDLENKVSQDKFHNSLSTLDQSVQDLVEKLVGHEATLKQAINHITSDVNSKLDKMDMDNVKDYFEGKLKDLHSKVQRKPNEEKSQAAASRSMLLQPANCISCDRPVHLYREGTKLPSLPLNKALPASKSNRPYMSFDLHDVRQKMYDVHNLRCKEQTESLGLAKIQNELLKLGAIKEGDDFPDITNRPCGGNHTLTCPEKRTTIRVNKAYREDLHFIAQLSQKDLSIVDILGYDGHVYKGHVNQLPSIPEIPKNTTMAPRPTTGSGRPRTSSPI